MLKLMLVDDEPVIRKGIRTSIDWEKYGVEIAGEASNGRDALARAMELKPNIVITDIRMPVMDGLALADSLKTQLPDTRIIILSGYDDFDYARKALSIGVCEYLLKPVRAEELVELIVKFKNEIVKAQLEKSRSLTENITFNESLQQIRANFLSNLLKGEYSDKPSIFEKAEALKLDLTGPEHLVFVIEIDGFHNITRDMPPRDIDLLKFSVMNISEELLQSRAQGFVCYSESEHLIGLAGSKGLTEVQMESVCKNMQYFIKKYLGFSVSIGIGRTRKSILDTPGSYSEALTALKSKIYRGKKSILFFDPQENVKKPESVLYPFNEEKEMAACLKTLDIDGINAVIDKIFTGFAESRATPESVKNICSRMIVTAISCMGEMGVDMQGKLGASFNPYREVEVLDVLEDLRKWLLSFFESMIVLVQKNKTEKFKGIIKAALKYIEENYQRDITLADISSIVYVTPNYLSRVFKEELGVNFVEWLNKFRVGKAKLLLLEGGAKTYEVAEKVGYRDYKYFSSIFKKYAGCSPKEFKENQY